MRWRGAPALKDRGPQRPGETRGRERTQTLGRRDGREKETKEDFLEEETPTQTPHTPSQLVAKGCSDPGIHQLVTGEATEVHPYSETLLGLGKGQSTEHTPAPMNTATWC